MTFTPKRLRRLSAGLAASAVVGSGLLMVAPANAAGSVTVGKADIASNESTYAGWHNGGAADGSYDVTPQGLELKGKAQVIKGYENTTKTFDEQNFDLNDLEDASYDVTDGTAYFQVPIFFNSDTTTRGFATLRPVVGATGDTDIDLDDEWMSSKAINSDIAANEPHPLSEIIGALDDYKTIGFGVLADAGDHATVKSIDFDGTDYEFAQDEQSALVTNADVDGYEDGNYTRWHQGYANADHRQQVTHEGLVMAPESQVVKGLENNSSTLDTRNFDLTNIGDVSYDVTDGTAYFQVPLFFKSGATSTFATLRNDGTPGTLAYDTSWVSSKAIGSVAADTPTPLADIVAALGTYKVIGFGVVTTAGETATVQSINFDGTAYQFDNGDIVVNDEETVREKDIANDETPFAQWHQGYAGADPVQVTSERNLQLVGKSQVIKGLDNNDNNLADKNISLGDAISKVKYTVVDGSAFFQIPMFVKDGGVTTFTTLRPAQGVGEGIWTISVGDQWVSSKTVGSIVKDTAYPLATIIDAFRSSKVIGFGFLSDAGSHADVRDVTWDGTKYTFKNAAPTAGALSASTESGKVIKVTLPGTDADGNALTFTPKGVSVSRGTTVLAGNQLTYTPNTGYVGTFLLTYGVSDGRGGENGGTIRMQVKKAVSKTAIAIAPTAPTTKTAIKVSAKITSSGSEAGGRVTYRLNGKQVAVRTASSSGASSFTLPKLKKGTYTIRVEFAGTASTVASARTYVVAIKK